VSPEPDPAEGGDPPCWAEQFEDRDEGDADEESDRPD
jgi:hypothetical protein